MSNIGIHIAQEVHHRVLDCLKYLCAHLLSESIYDQHFFPRGQRFTFQTDAGGSVDYVFRNRVTSFEPVLVGSVKSISRLGPGFGLAAQLKLPAYSSTRMDVFYWNQCAALDAAINSDTHLSSQSVSFEEVVSWCSPSDQCYSDGRLIDPYIPEHAYFRCCLPSAISIGANCDSLVSMSHSDARSSTLADLEDTGIKARVGCENLIPSSSTCSEVSSAGLQEPDDDHLDSISPGHTLICKCSLSLSCRDFPRGPTDGKQSFIRVYTITAVAVECIV
ncbi:hypothetical protein C8R43DRAFT_1133839 [Mycena crocata]|nr:hypothetical protein C8R43DRAFT_1133839 [Mycena crocata]